MPGTSDISDAPRDCVGLSHPASILEVHASSSSEGFPKLKYWVGIEGLFAHFFAWMARRMPSERQRLLAITIIAGGLCGLAAVAFHISVTWLYGMLIDRAASAPGHCGSRGRFSRLPWVGW